MNRSDQQDALDRKLAALLARAQNSAAAEPDPSLQHQLGDVYAEMERRPEALAAYGRAIDGFIGSGKTSVATVICSKVIKRFPGVTRTHFTLSCLLMHAGRMEDGLRALQAYADATRKSDTTGMAIPRLRFLAGLFSDLATRRRIAALLTSVGDDEANLVVDEEPPAHAANLTTEKRAELLAQMAAWGSDALWSGYWLRGG